MRQVIHRSPADIEQLGLTRDAEFTVSVDHGFALSNPALVSALSKKSFSSASWPILACSGARFAGSGEAPPAKTSAARSSNSFFYSLIWFGCNSNCSHSSANTLFSRQNDKATGCIILIMQRLHEDDLVGHVLGQKGWELVCFPAIAEVDEEHLIETPYRRERFSRRAGEALHTERESLEVLDRIRSTPGAYDFAGQYQQAPAPLGGGLVKREWFKTHTLADAPEKFDQIIQSWDTANKANELANYSVCTTWGLKGKQIYLLHVLRKQLDFPNLVCVVDKGDAHLLC